MTVETNSRKFTFKDLFPLLKESYKEWNDDEPWRQSAVVAYYAIFSLPALLIIVVTLAGQIFGQDAVQGRIANEVSAAVGQEAAESIQTMIENAYTQKNSVMATIVGIATLIFGSTGVFYQLQQSLNKVWEVEPDKDAGFKKLLKDRASSFGIILVIGFLLLISLLLSTALSVLSDYISNFLPDFTVYVFFVVEVLVSFGIVTLLFAMIFKFLPDVDIEWRSVWIGAMVTSGLFVLGKYLLSIYFGAANPASAYGTAGSVILILLWVSYSCLVLFFGAEFTQVYARTYRHKIQPSGHAKKSDRFDKKIGRAIRNIGSGSKDNPDKHSKNAELESAKSKATTNDPDTIVIKRKRPLTD
jgi:membrane protein